MNLLDIVGKNIFLEKVFSNGITSPVKVAKLDLAKDGRSTIHVHITQNPTMEVKKWGEWGKSFNTVNLILSGSSITNVEIKNWEELGYCDLSIEKIEGGVYLSQENDDCHIKFSCDGFSFKEIRVHWNDEN